MMGGFEMAAAENNVRAVERALQILDCFATGKTSFTLMELSREIKLSPSTTLRLVTTLEGKNYIHRDPENLRYYLGFKLARISNTAFGNLDFCRVARPYLKQLNETFGESTGLYTIRNDRRICVDRVEGTKSLRNVVQIGDSHSLTRGASGRVLLAYLPEEKILHLLEKDPFTDLASLEAVRRAGFAVSHGEREAGTVSIAAPVFNAAGNVVAALFVTGPAPRFDDETIERVRLDTIKYAKQISFEMGYVPPFEEKTDNRISE